MTKQWTAVDIADQFQQWKRIPERYVTLEEHEHALAEKDSEIKALEDNVFYLIPNADVPITWKEHAGYLQEQLDNQARELERLKQRETDLLGDLKGSADAYDGLNEDYNDLLRTAVEFAQKLQFMMPPIGPQARTFLATPAATALQQAKGEK